MEGSEEEEEEVNKPVFIIGPNGRWTPELFSTSWIIFVFKFGDRIHCFVVTTDV